jgi:hypothetical protein
MKPTRKTLSFFDLERILIAETAKLLAGDASLLRDKIKISRSKGQPNWDATIDMVGLATLRAFETALRRIRAHYNLI